ncbi:hypothetical protein SEA_APHELION_88 [Gordonia phage Aphelion]|uniref:Uncharacterized protein n=1 Tax=Gordonia phage Aphelion TaxID=2507860 RepID=A0A410TD57_9CAUD|nr:hypothetical protein SEA_TONIANN_89 [Gordonia phage Toniann]QAU06953.1 hypothetical protein SEA_APHELION_88 [Gordonia phage Aphelion]QYC53573.1 hypothetical protein SEA_NORVS_89 [Gordonia phage Norvs]
MSRKSMQADIDTLYKILGDINKDVIDVQIAQAKTGPAVGVAGYIAEWRVKLELLHLYEGNVDLAQSALEWLIPSDGKVDTKEVPA